ncbi:hypothetical protein F4680DRAFT_238077 [Xylaria scruposa]|nr:hypothetical protein F4680DRAFT_238077 [Xylaria scruposa]
MSSKKRQGKRSVRPPSRPDPGEATDTEAGLAASDDEPVFKRRQASLYDAVAGRVTTTLPMSSYESKHHRRSAPDSRRNSTLAPEDVLFKRSGAPVRYAEKDIYQAHENLPDGGRGILPDSDLLKTIHSYASHFYRDLPANKETIRGETGTGVSERSMDETALLAFGILLEEAGREALGKRGDLVFTEGAEVGELKGGRSDEEAEVFGIKDASRYEARGRLKRLRESDRDA